MVQETKLRVLIVGNGGREHAFAWKLSQSPLVEVIYIAPGNGGTGITGSGSKIANANVKGDDYVGLVDFAQENGVNLVVPGPEAPLVDGIQGYFQAVGIKCFGPSKAAARVEGSKTFAKAFMKRHGIPTAQFGNFSDYDSARKYLDSVSHQVVIKADGLAGGKGVLIPATKEEAHRALRETMVDRQFGPAGDEVVIEEFLDGDELSIVTFTDGYTIRSLPPAQDHKRIFDGDLGPNTGGMGCYAPTRIAPREVVDEIERVIVRPTVNGMRRDGDYDTIPRNIGIQANGTGFPMVGILFTGLMMTKNGPKVLEYNVRGGDPETQTLLPLLSQDTDLARIMVACTEHYLDGVDIKVEDAFSATIVAVAGGYPGSYAKGTPITLATNNSSKDTHVFHAGTSLNSKGQLVTAGGRVIAATSTAPSLEGAVHKSYQGLSTVKFGGMFYRKDIAHRAFRKTEQQQLTYASAGVSIDTGNQLVHNIKNAVSQTKRPGTDALIGGFGGIFSLAAASSYPENSPNLIGAIDGVGTKLAVAHAMNTHDTVGIDLVAMNVNDLVVQGAEPLFFLDCYSCSRLDLSTATAFVNGVATGCVQAGCALIGGETAEMPGLFANDQVYDAVGAAVGAINKAQSLLPNTSSMKDGDAILGLASSGPHSNGYSLIRKIVHRSGLDYTDACPFAASSEGKTLGSSLLTPTRIYVKPLRKALSHSENMIKGLAHITGGGILENIPRVLPPSLCARINVQSWTLPPVFSWLKCVGDVPAVEMARTFNCGVGMAVIVDKSAQGLVTDLLEKEGETVFQIGHLLAKHGNDAVVLDGLETWN